jgi:hypothetical protein
MMMMMRGRAREENARMREKKNERVREGWREKERLVLVGTFGAMRQCS